MATSAWRPTASIHSPPHSTTLAQRGPATQARPPRVQQSSQHAGVPWIDRQGQLLPSKAHALKSSRRRGAAQCSMALEAPANLCLAQGPAGAVSAASHRHLLAGTNFITRFAAWEDWPTCSTCCAVPCPVRVQPPLRAAAEGAGAGAQRRPTITFRLWWRVRKTAGGVHASDESRFGFFFFYPSSSPSPSSKSSRQGPRPKQEVGAAGARRRLDWLN